MNRILVFWGASALAVTGVAGTAVAQQAVQHKPGGMAMATVTRAEAQTKAGAMFERMDANKDGKIDAADREARLGQRFDAMDSNRDGKIDRGEFMAGHAPKQGADGHRAAMGEGRGMMHHGYRGHGKMAMRMLGKMDTNGDKAVTRAEFVTGMLARFDAADANKDGKVTPEERRAAMRAHMDEMGGMDGMGSMYGMGGMDGMGGMGKMHGGHGDHGNAAATSTPRGQ